MNRFFLCVMMAFLLSACSTDKLSAPNIEELRASSSQVTLFWNAPESATVSIYLGSEEFEVENYAAFQVSVVGADVSPTVIKGLDPDTTYYVAAVAVDGERESAPSEFATITTDAVFSAQGGVNDTGINWCMDDDFNIVDCDEELHQGQDGLTGRDKQHAEGTLSKVGFGPSAFDYTKVDQYGNTLSASAENWSCARDNVTGLMWEVKTVGDQQEITDLHDVRALFSWYSQDADTNVGDPGSMGRELSCPESMQPCNTESFIAQVNNTNLCGRDDWRLPTVREFISLSDYGTEIRDIGEEFTASSTPFVKELFPFEVTLNPRELHTSEPIIGAPDRAWQLNLRGGTFIWYKTMPTPIMLVTDVKQDKFEYQQSSCTSNALSSNPIDQFSMSSDGEAVLDTNANLEWQRCPVGQSLVNGECQGSVELFNWPQALAHANEQQNNGWRLPNIKELATIVDYSCEEPALNPEFFPSGEIAERTWSNTPGVYSNSFVGHFYYVRFLTGNVRTTNHSELGDLRLVRDIE